MILYLTMLSSYFFLSKNNLKQISKLVYTHVLFLSTKFLISWAKQSNHINLNNDLLFGLNHLATWLSLTRNPTLSAVKGPNNGTIHQLFETTRCSNNHCFVFNVPLWSAFSHGTFRQLLSQSRCPIGRFNCGNQALLLFGTSICCVTGYVTQSNHSLADWEAGHTFVGTVLGWPEMALGSDELVEECCLVHVLSLSHCKIFLNPFENCALRHQ